MSLRTPRTWMLLLAGVGLAGILAARSPGCAPPSNEGITVRYTVEPVPGEGFRVELSASGLGRAPRFRMLNGWGMLQDMPGRIRDLEARTPSGEVLPVTVEPGPGETRYRVEGAEESFVLSYRVEGYDPYLSPESSFVDQERFLFLGYSVFLLPRGVRFLQPLVATVHVVPVPGQQFWSPWPDEGGLFRPETAHDLWSGIVAGGDFHPTRIGTDRVHVTVLTEEGTGRTAGFAIANRLLPVLREMIAVFGEAPRSDTLGVLAVFRTLPEQGRVSIMNGTSEEGSFLCLATPDRYHRIDPLTVLAAHECLHFYLGGALTAEPEPPYRNTPELTWFVEGVTEYLSYRLLERAGVIGSEELDQVTRRKYREYRETPGFRSLTVADAARRMDEIDVYRLVYSRGYLVARLLDQEMARIGGEGALERALADLFLAHNAYRGGRAIDPEAVKEALRNRAPGIDDFLTRYAEGSTRIPAPEPEPVAASRK